MGHNVGEDPPPPPPPLAPPTQRPPTQRPPMVPKTPGSGEKPKGAAKAGAPPTASGAKEAAKRDPERLPAPIPRAAGLRMENHK